MRRSRLPVLLAVTALASSAGPATAEVIYWDGGGGTENWADADNWSTNALPAATDDIAFFESPDDLLLDLHLGADRTVRNVVNADLYAKRLTIGSPADVAAGHALTLSGGRLDMYPSPAAIVVAVDLLLGSDGYINASTPTRITGVVRDGGAGHGLHSYGRLILSAANTYSGPTSSDSIVVFDGPDGSAVNSPAFTVSGLALDNARGVNNDRVNDAASVRLRGGSLSLRGHLTDPVTETVGDVTFARGRNYIGADRSGAETADVALRMRSLTRQNRAVGSVDGGGRILLSNPPALVGSGAIGTPGVGTIPYLFGDDYDAVPATYDPGPDAVPGNTDDVGLRGLRTSELSSLDAAAEGDNVSVSGDAPGPITGMTINSLSIGNTRSDVPITGTGTLGIRSGQIIVNRGGSYGKASISGFDAVDFGAAEAVLHNAVGDGFTASFEIASPIRGSGGLTKSGYGTVRLAGVHDFSGTVTVLDGGPLEVDHASGLGTGGEGVVLDGGTLGIAASFATDRRISVADWGAVRVDTDVTLTLASPLVLGGGFSKEGGGTLVLAAPGEAEQRNFAVSGTLVLQNDTGSATGDALLYVQARSTLAGSGAASGRVTVHGGGRVSPGTGDDPVATLTTGDLVLRDGSSLRFDLGDPAHSDRLLVNGDLSLDGTLFVTALDGFGSGTYRLIDYDGALMDDELSVGRLAPAAYQYRIDTVTPGQVNLVVSVPEPTVISVMAVMLPMLHRRRLKA